MRLCYSLSFWPRKTSRTQLHAAVERIGPDPFGCDAGCARCRCRARRTSRRSCSATASTAPACSATSSPTTTSGSHSVSRTIGRAPRCSTRSDHWCSTVSTEATHHSLVSVDSSDRVCAIAGPALYTEMIAAATPKPPRRRQDGTRPVTLLDPFQSAGKGQHAGDLAGDHRWYRWLATATEGGWDGASSPPVAAVESVSSRHSLRHNLITRDVSERLLATTGCA